MSLKGLPHSLLPVHGEGSSLGHMLLTSRCPLTMDSELMDSETLSQSQSSLLASILLDIVSQLQETNMEVAPQRVER